jgi:hypothetical protein
MFSDLRNFDPKLGNAYESAFERYFEKASRSMCEYVQTLSPSLQQAIRNFSPQLAAGETPSNLKPHSIWIAQFFGITDEEVIGRAFTASLLMETHCCLQDRRIDRELRNDIDFVTSDALSNVLLADSLSRFTELAGDDPSFQDCIRSAFCDLAEAYAAEASGQVPYMSREKMFKAIVDRAAPFHILVAAMGFHSGRRDRIAPCSQLTCHLIMWFQLLDDAADWEKDLARGRRSYLLHRIEPLMDGKPFEEWTSEQVADALFLYGGAEGLLQESIEQITAALRIAEEHAAPPALADTADAMTPWLRQFLHIHRSARDWSIGRKREFLNKKTA